MSDDRGHAARTASWRSWAPWIALAVVVVAVIVWAAQPSGAPTPAERARALAAQLRCPDCESLSAADAQTSSARAIRRDLRARVAEGQSDATIRQAYVERYGEAIVLEPERRGLGLLVWGLPVVMLGAGALGLALAFRRWRRLERRHATPDDEAIVREARRDGPTP
ncbi:MAG: cytochrome c-type biogenesis protein CcmH [Actinomycetota bacterium]